MPLIEISIAPHLSAVDLWLHTTSSTVTKKIEVAIDGPFNYGVTQTLCHNDPYPPIYSNPFDPVLQILRLLTLSHATMWRPLYYGRSRRVCDGDLLERL